MLREKYRSEIDTLLARYAEPRSAVLPMLFIAQDEYGHLTPDAVREVADVLSLPATDVFEVVGFYSLFYDKPVGTWMLQVCDDVPCCYTGAEDTIQVLKQRLGVRENQTTPDGTFTLQRVKCVAACNRAPVIQANLNYVYNVTPDKVDALLRDLRKLSDGGVAMGTSGRNAEDFDLSGDGLQIISRSLGPIEAPATAPVEAEQPAPTTAPEPEKTEQQEAQSAPEEPAREQAEKKIEEESPTVGDGTNIERPNLDQVAQPSMTGKDTGQEGVQPANTTSTRPPEINPVTTGDTKTEAARGLREGEDVKKTDSDTIDERKPGE
ncbi:MAG: NADH-quinone oxidoreductase subunit NuoE [Chloroflexales bacterium]|nr:NADH-quinone oxidoreductase subunit NuoE [Chloroflexales bacterium]